MTMLQCCKCRVWLTVGEDDFNRLLPTNSWQILADSGFYEFTYTLEGPAVGSTASVLLYDLNGNPQQVRDRKSQVTQTTFDPINRPKVITWADSSTTTLTWDAGNRLTQVVDSISGTITRTWIG
jgi:YD repeat-containing protein